MPESIKQQRPTLAPETDVGSPQAEAEGLDYLSLLHQSIGNRAVGRLLGQVAPVQRIAATPDAPVADEQQALSDVEAAKGGGSALDPETRAAMESSLGHDFSAVRVHFDPSADALSQRLNARAFTTGSDIFFQRGAFDPGSDAGRETLTHELTHVVQQSGMGAAPRPGISTPGDASEVEAAQVAAGQASLAQGSWSAPPAAIQRDPTEEEKKKQAGGGAPGTAVAEPPEAGGNAGAGSSAGSGGGVGTPVPPPSGAGSGEGPAAQPAPSGSAAGENAPPAATGGPAGSAGAPGAGASLGQPNAPGAGAPSGTATPTVTPPGGPSGATNDNKAPTGGTGGPPPGGTGTPGQPGPGTGTGPDQQVPPAVNTPTIANPKTGVDWPGMSEKLNYDLSTYRLVLEMSRGVPILNLFTGAAADAIWFMQDLDQLNKVKGDHPYMKGAMIFRDSVNFINNLVGAIAQIDQLIQNAALGSGEGAPAAAVTSEVQLALKSAKFVLDEMELGADILITAGARYEASKSDPDSLAGWNSIITNYEANILGDSVNMIFDGIDLVTAGLGNGENAKGAMLTIKNIGTYMGKTGPTILKSAILGWWGVLGSGAMPTSSGPSAAPAPAAAGPAGATNAMMLGGAQPLRAPSGASKRAAAAIMTAELAQMRDFYNSADLVLTLAITYQNEMFEQQRELIKQLMGGKDPLKTFLGMVNQGLDNMNAKVDQFRQMAEVATSAKERTDIINSYADKAIADVTAITVPKMNVAPANNDGGVIDAAAQFLQDQVVARVQAQIESAIADAKTTALAPVRTVKDNAKEIGEFSVIVQQTATGLVEMFQTRIQTFQARLAKCNSLEDIFNTLVATGMEVMGMEPVSFDEIVAGWRAIGPMLDETEAKIAVWANAPDEEEGGGGPSTASAEPPPEEPAP